MNCHGYLGGSALKFVYMVFPQIQRISQHVNGEYLENKQGIRISPNIHTNSHLTEDPNLPVASPHHLPSIYHPKNSWCCLLSHNTVTASAFMFQCSLVRYWLWLDNPFLMLLIITNYQKKLPVHFACLIQTLISTWKFDICNCILKLLGCSNPALKLIDLH